MEVTVAIELVAYVGGMINPVAMPAEREMRVLEIACTGLLTSVH